MFLFFLYICSPTFEFFEKRNNVRSMVNSPAQKPEK